jgi:small-conductance mechanosensitive channel
MDISFLKRWTAEPLFLKFTVIVLGILVIQVIFFFFKRYVSQVKDTGTRYRLRKITSFGKYLAIILLIIILFSDRLEKLTLILGVAGAGIAFALQEVIVSFAGWLAISFGSFYSTGDRIQLGGIKGDVIDIGILRTTLMEIGEWVKSDQYTGRIVQVANSFVFKEPVFNYSGDFPFLWDEIAVPIKYGSDYKLARQLMKTVIEEVVSEFTDGARLRWQEMVKKYMIEDAALNPAITLVANDNWVEFTIRFIVDFKKRRIVKDHIYTRLLEEIDKTLGRVAIASTTVHIVETPVFDVRITEESKGHIPHD